MIRLLVYDGQGFWAATKRLSKGRFRFWCGPGNTPGERIAAHQLQTLIVGGDFAHDTAAAPWRSVG